MSDEQDDTNKNQHEHAHALASVVQEAIEDYVDGLDEGDVLAPMAIYFATQIVSHGWLRFLQQRGAEQGQMMGFALQALPCSDKLVERLLGTGDKYVPEPADVPEPEPEPDAEHTTPRFFMDGPGEEC